SRSQDRKPRKAPLERRQAAASHRGMKNLRAPDYVRGAAAALVFAVLTAPVALADKDNLRFSVPVACTLGETCFLQALIDHDPSEESRDFACGTLTRDGHQGSDFALQDLAAMRAGVEVLAAASGTVTAIRDRLPDINANDPDADFGEEFCGNAVRINHGGGWATLYCHLKRGSVRVAPGMRVDRGAPVGEIGLSGSTTFPHLHFSIFKDDVELDPFAAGISRCGEPGATLWEDPVPLQQAGFLKAGFADHVPAFDDIDEGLRNADKLSATGPIVVWVSGFGAREGDEFALTIWHGEDVFFERIETLDRRQETWQRYLGRRAGADPWPSGTYRAEVTLKRDGTLLAATELTATIPAS
ncbi:MAG: M23 family metallopeptidase, partial [Pseudomonadota bacterium]